MGITASRNALEDLQPTVALSIKPLANVFPPQSLVAQPLHHFCPCHWGSPSNQSSGLAPCLLSGICCLYLRTHCSGSLAPRLRTASIEAQDAITPYKPGRLQRCATSISPLPSINLAITSISNLHSSHITSSSTLNHHYLPCPPPPTSIFTCLSIPAEYSAIT
jgi:hypothetical protein